ncbi:hypothetical protein [Chenggangzhangella methanolivorans]|uniref:hypothetical protein n=1 Tax=Chenggangzhangella methanolivorans TaxID=1437009 RepID=UPI0021BD1C25|nr:hypothetical protein [Chenggangzhangella methanolivorans]
MPRATARPAPSPKSAPVTASPAPIPVFPPRPAKPLSTFQIIRTATTNSLSVCDEQMFDDLIVSRRYGTLRLVVVSDPEAVRQVLLDKFDQYPRWTNTRRLFEFELNTGTLSSEGEGVAPPSARRDARHRPAFDRPRPRRHDRDRRAPRAAASRPRPQRRGRRHAGLAHPLFDADLEPCGDRRRPCGRADDEVVLARSAQAARARPRAAAQNGCRTSAACGAARNPRRRTPRSTASSQSGATQTTRARAT